MNRAFVLLFFVFIAAEAEAGSKTLKATSPAEGYVVVFSDSLSEADVVAFH